MNKIFIILFACSVMMSTAVYAVKSKIPDTVSTADVTFKPSKPTVDIKKATTVQPVNIATIQPKENDLRVKTPWTIFIAGLLGGFAAILMPCIFPMLPMTVSYFTKGNSNSRSGIFKAVIYGLSIMVIYVILGLAITLLFGPDALNSLSTNGLFNMGFFLMLTAFAASFLGAFEITLPNKWINKMDKQSDRKGLAGIFFMATTLSLVSFSCTGPIIGTLLVQAATTGAILGPAMGMLGFSLALALPFTVFAMFPNLMSAMPRSGSWLNSVKVTLGFLELALALKFLSNVDLAYHWKWFDREIFIVLWIVIFGMLGYYLLGKLKFAHDTELSFISVPRLFLAMIVFSFTVYLLPGLWGAPLRSVSAFLPPMATQDFDLSQQTSLRSREIDDGLQRKYADLFDAPKGFSPYFDYQEGLAYAKKSHKPVLIDFTGHACVNCRKMEANVWTDAAVAKIITGDFVLIQLYVDDKTDLPLSEQSTSPDGRSLNTLGKKWSYLQTSRFGSNSQPFYVLLNPDTEQPLLQPQGADYDPGIYFNYLKKGLSIYHEN